MHTNHTIPLLPSYIFGLENRSQDTHTKKIYFKNFISKGKGKKGKGREKRVMSRPVGKKHGERKREGETEWECPVLKTL